MKRIIYILLSVMLISCEGFVDVGPDRSALSAELVFENDNTALAALEAVYHELQFLNFASGNMRSITYLGNILADDAIEYNTEGDRYQIYTNNLRADNASNTAIWSSAFTQMYRVNALLEGIEENVHLSAETKQRIEGEAKFLRAFIYYYLVHLYGEVPSVLSTDYSVNQSLARSSEERVYTQIINDLDEASKLLPEDYRYGDYQRIRPTKYAAYILLARMALWQEDYPQAIDYANNVLQSSSYQLVELDKVFKANSLESVWQLVPVNPTVGANEGYHYILQNNPALSLTVSSISLTEDFMNLWEMGDLRSNNWIGIYTEGTNDYYYPFKYKIKNGGDSEEYSMVIRLAELYLIRAEAYARSTSPNIQAALDDLNEIRNRAGLPDLTTADVSDIEQTVLDERRRELFSEWGHRWLDLKRFGKIDEVLGQKKPGWQPHAKLLPIPEQDLLRNPFLTQNPGY